MTSDNVDLRKRKTLKIIEHNDETLQPLELLEHDDSD